MFVSAYDSKRLINVSLHVGEGVTDAEVENIVATIDEMVRALASNKKAYATSVVLVETDVAPTAKQRKRIGEAASKLPRSYQILVTQSAIVRAVTTAIKWFSADKPNNHHESFATWPEARDWLVQRTGHPREAFETLVADVRARVAAARG